MAKRKIYIPKSMVESSSPRDYNDFIEKVDAKKVMLDGTNKDQFVFSN